MVPPARLERTTPRLGIWCSIHLSYGGMSVKSAHGSVAETARPEICDSFVTFCRRSQAICENGFMILHMLHIFFLMKYSELSG